MNPNLLIGQTVDRYRISEMLGQGGMAEVYLAEDIELRRPVVLKMMLPRLAQDADFVARFRREAQATARLNHPNIVQVYTTGSAPDGRLYIALQYIKGGTLGQYIQRMLRQTQWMPTMQALSIVRQMASALQVAHSAGIVHRDIKPSNILLRDDGTAVLADLGIAAMQTEATRLTQTGSMPGTPQYMSPEQGTSKDVDGRSDIYSLGIILYELLGGRLPFESQSPWGLIHQHIHEPVPPLRNIRQGLSEETYQIVETCLQKAPDDRYATAMMLVAALDRATLAEQSGSGLARTMPVQPTPTSSGSKNERSRWLWGALALIPMLLLLGWGGFRLINSDTSGNGETPEAIVVVAPTATATTHPVVEPTDPPPVPDDTSTPEPTATATMVPTPQPTLTPTLIPTPGPMIRNFSFCLEACTGGNETRVFPALTTRVYVSWEFENFPIGSNYVRSWSMDGDEWVRYQCQWRGPISGSDTVTLREPEGLKSGVWQVIISVDDIIVAREQFTVQGQHTLWAPVGTINDCFDNR